MAKVLSLLVGCDDGTVQSYFGIWHEGKLWLVTAWIVNKASGEATPERMIRVDSLSPSLQKCGPKDRFDFANILLPISVIAGKTEDTEGYEVRSLPDSPVVHRNDLYTLPSFFSDPD